MLYHADHSAYVAVPETITPVVTRRVSHTVVDGHKFCCVHTAHGRWVGYFSGDNSGYDLTGRTRKELLAEARAELQLRKGTR